MSIFSPFVSVVQHVISIVGGKGGTFVAIITKMVSYMPELLNSINTIIKLKDSDGKLDDREKAKLIVDAWETFDATTGLEGISFFHSKTELGKVLEETALDNFKQFGKITSMLSQGIDELIINDVMNNEVTENN